MNRKFASILAVTVSGAVLAVAGYAIANVPDDQYIITDKKEPGTQAELDVRGDDYEVDIVGVCTPFPGGDSAVGSRVEIRTNHPDSVKLKKNKGEVEQSQKDNPDPVTVRIITGSGTLVTDNLLTCKKVEAKADIKDKKSPFKGSFSASGEDCECDPTGDDDCADYDDQITQLGTDCNNNKTIKGDFKDGVIKKFAVKGSGDAIID